MLRLSRRMCWSLGAACVAAGLGLPWAAAQVSEGEGVPVVETVRLRPALVRLPGGSFLMGSPEGEEYVVKSEQPQRLVEIPAFSMCQTEVTQGQYTAVMGRNRSNCAYGCGDELPVQNLRWIDVLFYLNRLTAKESKALGALGEARLTACYTDVGRKELGWVKGCTGYRLPTEAEWEYAARAGTTTRWSFGNDEEDLGDYAWFSGNATGLVHAVGTKKANPWGLYDMHGNVWEWVWDAYDSYKSGKVINSDGDYRVLRGGSFVFEAGNQHSAVRNTDKSAYLGRYHFGFRCARGPGPQR